MQIKRKDMEMLEITSEVSITDLIHQLNEQCCEEELIDAIMLLDSLVANWDFTKELYERFSKAMEGYENNE